LFGEKQRGGRAEGKEDDKHNQITKQTPNTTPTTDHRTRPPTAPLQVNIENHIKLNQNCTTRTCTINIYNAIPK
jgi:hypothetical protein